MIQYTWKGEPFNSPGRSITTEICLKHGIDYIDDALRREKYDKILVVGVGEVASIDLYRSRSKDNEFEAIALLEVGNEIETYVFSDYHAAMVFLKEFTPLIESLIRIDALAQE